MIEGWLDKVLLVLTIHDELVFEIREDVAGEAIPIIEDVMVRRPVQNLNWVIPLKVDIEFGLDWTVPFNLTEMAANKGEGEVGCSLGAYFSLPSIRVT